MIKLTELLLLIKKFINTKTANGATDITDSNKKLFLNPLMLTSEMIIADKRLIAIET